MDIACLHGNYSLSKLFIKKGADVNTRTYAHRHTPLHLSAQYNHRDIVKLLIDNGADINARDVNGCTPLHYCATNGHTESAETLLDKGASPNEANLRENIPLHSAAKWGHAMMVQCLLSHGSFVDKFNADNLMPIQVSLWVNNYSRISLIGTPGDRRNLFVLSGIRINRIICIHLYRLGE